MSDSYIFTIVVFFLVAGVIFLGWIFPLVMGIRRRRRQSGGTGLIAFGGVWGTLAIVLLCFAIFAIYSIRRQMQVETFDPANYKGQTGTITLPWNGDFSLNLFVPTSGRSGLINILGKEGHAIAPTGTFKASVITLTHVSSNRDVCTASTWFYGTNFLQFSVQTGKETHIDYGPPFVAYIQITQTGTTNVEFNYKLEDKQGNPWRVSNSKATRNTGFEVLDKTEKVVMKGDFQYG